MQKCQKRLCPPLAISFYYGTIMYCVCNFQEYKRLSAASIARYRPYLSSDTPFGLVWQLRQENLWACDQAGLDGYSAGRMNCGTYAVDAVVYIAAVVVVDAAVAIHQTLMLVVDVADETARSTGL